MRYCVVMGRKLQAVHYQNSYMGEPLQQGQKIIKLFFDTVMSPFQLGIFTDSLHSCNLAQDSPSPLPAVFFSKVNLLYGQRQWSVYINHFCERSNMSNSSRFFKFESRVHPLLFQEKTG